MTRKPYGFEFNGEEITLRDSVEAIAVRIAENFLKKERTETISQECKILDSLSNALTAINS